MYLSFFRCLEEELYVIFRLFQMLHCPPMLLIPERDDLHVILPMRLLQRVYLLVMV
jgi:hypothetical protein